MSEPYEPASRLAEDETLSAYLSGELDADQSAALEARLSTDPSLAERLDALADVVATLRGLDDVEPPPGFRERLDQRLAAERAPEVASLDAARARRRPRWQAVGLTAAAVTAVAVAATGLLQATGDLPGTLAGNGARIEAFDDAAAPDEAAEAVPEAEEEAVPDEPPMAEEDPVTGQDQVTDATAQVVVRDDEVALPGDAAIRARYEHLADATALLGVPSARAESLAESSRVSLDAAVVQPAGVPASACVDAVEEAVGAPAVVVLVESARIPEGRAVAHVVVTGTADLLDRVEAVLVEPATCAPLRRSVVRES